MSYVLWGIVALVVIIFLGGGGKKKRRKRGTSTRKKPTRTMSEKDKLAEANAIANKVTSQAQLRALEERSEKALERTMDLDIDLSEKALENAQKKADILEQAFDIASQKFYLWQFVPELDLHTPLEHIKSAYKIYPSSKLAEIQKSLPANETFWFGLYDEEDAEEPEVFLSSLKKFRTLIESGKDTNTTINKINEICASDTSFHEEFFDIEETISAGEQWFAEELSEDGLPDAYDFYAEGYRTPIQCLNIDPAEYSSRKGVGPKRMKQLKDYQSKVLQRSGREESA